MVCKDMTAINSLIVFWQLNTGRAGARTIKRALGPTSEGLVGWEGRGTERVISSHTDSSTSMPHRPSFSVLVTRHAPLTPTSSHVFPNLPQTFPVKPQPYPDPRPSLRASGEDAAPGDGSRTAPGSDGALARPKHALRLYAVLTDVLVLPREALTPSRRAGPLQAAVEGQTQVDECSQRHPRRTGFISRRMVLKRTCWNWRVKESNGLNIYVDGADMRYESRMVLS